METTNNNTYGNAKVSYPTENVATNSENTVYKSKTFFTEDVVGTSKTTAAVLSSMINKNMVGIPIRTEKWTGTTLANSAEIEYAAFNSTQLLPKNLHLRDNNSTNWVVKYTISDYNPDGLPAQIKMGGFTKSENYLWNRHLLQSKSFGDTYPNSLMWTYSYNDKDMVESITDENGLKKPGARARRPA